MNYRVRHLTGSISRRAPNHGKIADLSGS